MTAASIEPSPAVVKPRVISRQSGEILPLEDAVRLVAESAGRHVIWVVGGPGSGKTTALCHLAAVLPPNLSVGLIDDGSPADDTLSHVRVVTSTRVGTFTKPRDESESLYRLAPWTTDDLIEYLLHAHPDQCKDVMARIGANPAAERYALAGSPELWCIVLERMAGDETLGDVRETWRSEVDALIVEEGARSLIEWFCLEVLIGSEAGRESLWAEYDKSGYDKRLLSLARHSCVQNEFAAACVAGQLAGRVRDAEAMLKRDLPRTLVELVARSATRSTVRLCLEIVKRGPAESQAMAASLLHAIEADWKPSFPRAMNLSGAHLAGANWSGVSQKTAGLANADFENADLRYAQLDRAKAFRCRFRGADLRHASLTGIDAVSADFSEVLAQEADFTKAVLRRADFENANLEGAVLHGARLQGANLKDACLRGADLTDVTLLLAIIDGADFDDAVLTGARLRDLRLSVASFQGAQLDHAVLTGCDLEFMSLSQANFDGSALEGSWLTGSSMPGANFREASLRNTGLAEIDWPGADLRKADLRGATFHMGSSRSGLVGSPIACEGSRTGFYTDEYDEQRFKAPEEIRKANLCGADLRGARVVDVDFYLVDLRGAHYDAHQREHFQKCRAILDDAGC